MYIRKVITFRNAGTGCRYNIGTIFSFVLRTNSAGSTEETTQFHTTQPAGTGKAPLNYLSKRRHDARLHCVPTPRMPLRLIMHDEYSFRYIRSYNDDRQIAALRQRGHSGGIPVAGRGLYRRPHRPERSPHTESGCDILCPRSGLLLGRGGAGAGRRHPVRHAACTAHRGSGVLRGLRRTGAEIYPQTGA